MIYPTDCFSSTSIYLLTSFPSLLHAFHPFPLSFPSMKVRLLCALGLEGGVGVGGLQLEAQYCSYSAFCLQETPQGVFLCYPLYQHLHSFIDSTVSLQSQCTVTQPTNHISRDNTSILTSWSSHKQPASHQRNQSASWLSFNFKHGDNKQIFIHELSNDRRKFPLQKDYYRTYLQLGRGHNAFQYTLIFINIYRLYILRFHQNYKCVVYAEINHRK